MTKGPTVFSKQSYVYKIVDGCEISADIYCLPDDLVRPVILWLHGGALIIGSRETLSPDQLERYVEAGYVVVAVDYRLAPEIKLEAIIEDLEDAYTWLRVKGPELFRIDPERIAVIGHSAGGYLALMTGFRVHPRPKAIVSFYGYGDITGHWYSRPDRFYRQQPIVRKEEAYQAVGHHVTTGTSFEGDSSQERSRFYLYCRQQGLWPSEVTGHNPDEEAAWFDAFCPLRNVTKEYPPTLLIHGDQDTDVPFEQSVLMSAQLERHGVTQKLLALPGRGHGFDRDDGGLQNPAVAEVFDQILVFLEEQGMQG